MISERKNVSHMMDLAEGLRFTPRVIKAITAGRTGTTYVSRLFALLPGVVSLHEPLPNYTKAMRRAQQFPEAAYQFLREHKIPFINQHTKPLYIETSHLFCKGFFEPLVMLGLCPDLMIITRSPREIAKSLQLKNTVPARTTAGYHWLLAPHDPNVIPLNSWGRMSDYQLCYWYALEIERRQEKYSAMALSLGKKVATFTARSLNDFAAFSRVCAELGLPCDALDLQKKHFDVSAIEHNKIANQEDYDRPRLQQEEAEVLEAISSFEPLIALKHMKTASALTP